VDLQAGISSALTISFVACVLWLPAAMQTELPTFSDNYLTMDGWILVYSVENDRSFAVLREIYDKLRVNIQG
jgi:hypothetical protein